MTTAVLAIVTAILVGLCLIAALVTTFRARGTRLGRIGWGIVFLGGVFALPGFSEWGAKGGSIYALWIAFALFTVLIYYLEEYRGTRDGPAYLVPIVALWTGLSLCGFGVAMTPDSNVWATAILVVLTVTIGLAFLLARTERARNVALVAATGRREAEKRAADAERQLEAEKVRAANFRERLSRIERKDDEKDRAISEASELSVAEASRLTAEMLSELYLRASGLTDKEINLSTLSKDGEPVAQTWLNYRRLEQRGLAQVIEYDRTEWTDAVRLTAYGITMAERLDADQAVTSIQIERAFQVMGDQFWVGDNSVVVNRSSLKNSVNLTRQSHGDEVGQALAQLGEIVEGSRDSAAVELLNELNLQLESATPRKGVVRTLLKGIEDSLPAANGVAELVGKLSPLFTA